MSLDTLSRPLADRIASLSESAPPDDAKTLSAGAINGAVEALDGGKTHYTDRPGIAPLREWVSNHLQTRYNISVPADAITITCGGTEARFVSVNVLAKPKTAIYCAGDTGLIAGAAVLADAEVVSDMDDRRITVAYLTAHDGKSAMQSVMEAAKAKNWWVIWDMNMGREDYHPAQDAELAPKVVSVGSLSYSLPGWRIGWLAGSELAGKLRAYKQSMTICSPSISQWAALGWVENQ